MVEFTFPGEDMIDWKGAAGLERILLEKGGCGIYKNLHFRGVGVLIKWMEMGEMGGNFS